MVKTGMVFFCNPFFQSMKLKPGDEYKNNDKKEKEKKGLKRRKVGMLKNNVPIHNFIIKAISTSSVSA